jgi:acetyltransferase-like isoleucine patch superfamily enzyme
MLIKKNKLPLKELLLIGLLPSFMKVWLYRKKGFLVGKNVSIGLGSVIIGKEVEIKDNTRIGLLSVIRAGRVSLGRFVTIGSFVYIDTETLDIGEDSEIREYVYVAGLKTPESKLKLGKRCSIFQYCFLNPTKRITLGDDCGIGGLSKLFTHGSYLSKLDGYPVAFAPITLGNNVWIPWDVFILPGVTIGDNVVVGAGSVINRDIPSNCIAAGNPAKVVKENFPSALSEEGKKNVLSEIFSDFEHHLNHHHFRVAKQQFRIGFPSNLKGEANANSFTLKNIPRYQA